jgi:hypothetical protein
MTKVKACKGNCEKNVSKLMHNSTSVGKCKENESQTLPSTLGIHFGS